MARLQKTEAIVLKKRHLLNKDLIITLFTKEYGKMALIAKGIKKITSTRAPRIETGNLILVQISGKGEYHYLQQADLISGFSQLKEHQTKVNCLYTIFFILDRILPEQQKEEPVYRLSKSYIVELAKNDQFDGAQLTSYIHQLLLNLGYSHQERSLPELIRFTENIIQEKIPFNLT